MADPVITVVSDGADVVAIDVVVVAAPGDAPRVAVRAPVAGAVDVVNVESLGDDGDQRRVRFLVEAERRDVAFDVTIIVAVGGDERSYAGPHITPRGHG